MRRVIASWKKRASNGKSAGSRRHEPESYNDLARGNGSGRCRDATRPRDSLVGSSRRCGAQEFPLALSPQNHIGSVDPDALKIPAPKGGTLASGGTLPLHFTLNRNTLSCDFHSEPVPIE